MTMVNAGLKGLTLATLKYVCVNHRDHTDSSFMFSFGLYSSLPNYYNLFNYFSADINFMTSESDIYRHHILMSKDGVGD